MEKGNVNAFIFAETLFMKNILLPFFLFVLSNSFAQTNEPPAIIVTVKGDTINGNIRYSNWTANPSFIDFLVNGKATRYYPQDIKSFTFSNQRYVSSPVSFYTGSLDMGALPESFTEQRASETVFLKQLVVGKYSLYSYKSEIRQYFFIQKQEDAPIELVYRMKMKDRLLGEDKTYQTQLAGIAEIEARQANFVQQAYSLYYDANSFIKYIDGINGIPRSTNKDVTDKLYINVEAGAGVMIPYFIARGEAITAPINSVTADAAVAPVISAAVILSRNPQYSFSKFLFNVNVQSFPVRGRSETINTTGLSYYEQYDFRFTQLNTGLGMIQVLTSKRPMKVYASAITNVGWTISKPSDTKLINTANGSVYTTYKNYPPLQKISVSGIISIGLLSGRLRTDLYLQTPFRIVSQNKSNFSAMGFGFGLRYALKKY